MSLGAPGGPPSRAPGGPFREVWTLGLMAVLTCVLASCSTQAPSPKPTQLFTQTPGKRLTWMLTRAALAEVLSDPAARSRLDGAPVYEILRTGQSPLGAAGAIPAVTFSALGELERAVSSGGLPTEPGPCCTTRGLGVHPASRAAQPGPGRPAGAAAADAHGLRLIVAPALNLTTVNLTTVRPTSGPRWQQFLDLGLAGAMAKVADVIEMQAQSLERDTSSYAAFVSAAAPQARAANPKVTVLAGLSTNPPGTAVSSQQLNGGDPGNSGMVSGYWLNIPGRGPRCPTCNARAPTRPADPARPAVSRPAGTAGGPSPARAAGPSLPGRVRRSSGRRRFPCRPSRPNGK